jgi:hypothetical protein
VVATDAEGARLPAVRRRMTVAKAGLAVGGAAVFGAALVLARANDPGRPKQRLRPLAASPRYTAAVRKILKETGIIRPALSSPAAATGQS